MKKGLYVTMIVGIAAALLIGGCELLLGPDEAVGGGNLAIAFGESGGRGAAPADLERYDLVLTGPKEQKITVSLALEERFYQQVALGEWHIDAKAYKAGNVLIGTGSITVTVKPGRNEVRIPMRRVPVPDTPEPDAPHEDTFVAVTNITGIPTSGTVGVNLTLSGTITPANATNQAIVWSVKTDGGTGANITGNTLSTIGAGTVVVTATIVGGTAAGTDYTQDFDIIINATFVAVTGIIGVPTSGTAGTPLPLSGTVAPSNANQTIVWSVKDAGGTGAYIGGNSLSTSAGGTVVITATIADGLTVGTPYTEDFNITIIKPVSNITGVPSSGTAGASLTLTGMVAPTNATNQAIAWTVKNAGTTGASISGIALLTTVAGTVEVTATIVNGMAVGMNYTQDFNITILPAYTMKPVPAGSFRQDNIAGNVTIITRGYWMGETEVTQELFQAVMGTNPSNFTGGADGGEVQNKRPVEKVSWYAAIAFCNKLSLLDGKEPVYSVNGIINWASLAYSAIPISSDADWDVAIMDTSKNGYRLPTEMEWMWSAIGADTTSQPNTTGRNKTFAGSTGNNSVDDYAWYESNSNNKTHEVGMKAANELGLYDMSGNVHEWCWDWNGYYTSGTQTDPQGVSSGTSRVLRGGSWDNPTARSLLRFSLRDRQNQ